jgi:DNA-directed RNA polymerase II subunit RPB1
MALAKVAMALTGIRLRYYTDDEVRSLAVVEVQHASTYDRGVPKADGINDARMGLIDHTVRCPTCYKANCDQHFGFIELARPVYRLGTINTVIMVLRAVCRECARPKIEPDPSLLAGPPSRERLRAISDSMRTKMVCQWCKAPQPNYTKRARTFIDAAYRHKDLDSDFVKARGPTYLAFLKARFMPDDAAAILHGLSPATLEVFGLTDPEALMCKLQIVPPPIIRPSNFIGETKVRSENDLTMALQDVVRANLELKASIDGPHEAYLTAYDKLQVMVAGIVNSAIKKAAAQAGLLPMVTATSKRKIIDLKARLNGKKARVRGNLNGKRVDQSGRTVISGDASHDIDELGVPVSMMNKLTFPEPVTSLNAAMLASAVVLGSYVDDGALAVRPPSHSQDHVIWLPILDREARIDLAAQLRPGWIVERHLRPGDWVLFNRQPSLWKASMMAFRCYRVQGLTVRLPLPVTRAFNADFDGDEMNIHALQGYEAIAEAQELMAVGHQIVTPQSNSVIIGLVQDSLVGAWRLTSPGCLLNYEEATELLVAINYVAPGRGPHQASHESGHESGHYSDYGLKAKSLGLFHIPKPAVLKPVPLWTGKQIASVIIPTSVNLNRAPADPLDPDANLHVRHGSIVTGRLSKSSLGAASTGLVFSIWRLFGPGGAHKFVSDAQRLFVKHLVHDGPTQSIVDCLMDPLDETAGILAKHLGRSDAVLSLDLHPEVREAKASAILQETLRAVGAKVLQKVRPDSALANCVHSGSKGNVMNIAQIGGCVGQQTVYGRRVPIRHTRLGPRTLLYYAPGDLRAEARGFIGNSYISGLTPAEFFEHQMAGREGIVATAVNTSESGYNQRRMIKGQESQCIGYDGTVRVSSNIVIQTFYGGDDLDGSRLEKIKIPWLFEARGDAVAAHGPVGSMCVKVLRDAAAWKAHVFKSLELVFACGVSIEALVGPPRDACSEDVARSLWDGLQALHIRHHSAKKGRPNVSVAAAVALAIDYRIGPDDVPRIVEAYSKSLVAPGEGVGALGASSIGEPSMQMTLNVFHYSGIADKNVTITGLPRFKQLINGVDTYETANMTAQLLKYEYSDAAAAISVVMLSEVTAGSFIIDTWAASDPVSYMFKAYGAARGPFATKFAAVVPGRASASIHLDWAKCARKNMKAIDVAKALRETLSFDAVVTCEPYWAGSGQAVGPRIVIKFAPWIYGAHAICEGLLAQQQVRGLDYVKNAISFQQKTFDQRLSKQLWTSRHIVETEGSNMIDLAKCPFVNAETIISSNVVEVARVLGIATGLVILQAELHKVLSFDSSYIDPRHTWLLADTMGRAGTLAAMTRHNMEMLGSSLLQRASFEQSLDVFEEGASFGRSDPLAGATERIITGQPVCIGTGLMGLVSEVRPVDEPQFMVGPLDGGAATDDGPGIGPMKAYDTEVTRDEVRVRPLLGITERPFQVQTYGTKLSEMSRIPGDPFFENLANVFRSTAASKRVIPYVRLVVKLNEATYKTALAECRAYPHWTTTESSNMITEVRWTSATVSQGLTVLEHGPVNGPQSWASDLHWNHTGPKIDAVIYSQRRLEALEVPFGVSPASVVMRQQVRFVKGSFALIIGRMWTGNSNVEAEEAVLKTRGQPVAILEMIEPDTILQTRCTDAQLGNALENRLPV